MPCLAEASWTWSAEAPISLSANSYCLTWTRCRCHRELWSTEVNVGGGESSLGPSVGTCCQRVCLSEQMHSGSLHLSGSRVHHAEESSCLARQLNLLAFSLKRGFVSFSGKCSMWWCFVFLPPCSLIKMCALSMFSTQAHTQNVHVVKMHSGEVYPWHYSR